MSTSKKKKGKKNKKVSNQKPNIEKQNKTKEKIKNQKEIQSNDNNKNYEKIDKNEIKNKNEDKKISKESINNKENKKIDKKLHTNLEKNKKTINEKKINNVIKENKNNENKENLNVKNNDYNKEKSIKKIDDKPEYVQKMLKNRKVKLYIFVCIVILFVLVIAFSTLFAIFNLNNTNIIKGISIKDIDISNLNSEDAIKKLDEIIKMELLNEVNIRYGENYQVSLNPEDIEFKYELQNAVENAYLEGRSGNLLENNYTLIFTNLFGKKISLSYTYNENLLNQFIDAISSGIPGIVVEPSYYLEEGKLIINKGTDGIKVKKDELKENILNAIFDRNIEDIKNENFKQEIEIPIEQVKASDIDMDKIYSDIHTEPKDAYFETEPYKIYPDVDGIDLAISVEEAKNIIKSENKEEYQFDLNIKKASKTINDLGTEAFPYLVSSFSTKYDASNINRSTNLKISAQKINGKVIMPGEEFSYNKIVGKRTVEEGYRDAKIYADGGVVDGLAGGICQISSTLYNAVLLANLEVTERRNHTFTTSYVPAGRDATVVYGTIDFKFKNSRSYPIKIEAKVNNGIAEFRIYGVAEENEYEIRILPVTTGSIPYQTTYTQDPTLAPGQQVVSQSGHAGYRVTTYKEVRLNGQVISKEPISNDIYSPMKAIVRVGAGMPIQQ